MTDCKVEYLIKYTVQPDDLCLFLKHMHRFCMNQYDIQEEVDLIVTETSHKQSNKGE